MKSRLNAPQALSLAAVIALAGVVTLGANNLASRPTAVAVCDVQKVFSTMKEKADMEAEITRQTELLQKEEQAKAKEIRDLTDDLNILARDSDAFKQAQAKLDEKAIQLDSWRKYNNVKLENEKVIRIEGLYLKVLDSIENIAKKDGWDIVLYKDETEKLRGQSQQQLAAIIQTRKVLYANENLDISDQVLQQLDNEFNNRKK